MDALTALLLVLIFVLSIFMIVQFVLQESLTGKDRRLSELTGQISDLSDVLALERTQSAEQQSRIERLGQLVASLSTEQEAQRALVARLRDENTALGQSAGQLREKLDAADESFLAATLALESKRKEAEETLTLLAAAEATGERLAAEKAQARDEEQKKAALLETARAELARSSQISKERARSLALLNAQIGQMRAQLAALNTQLDAAEAREGAQKIQIADLGRRLNLALSRKVSELERYRSEFFGRMREILSERPDIRIVGDRFVFQSEVLFASGSASLGENGMRELRRLGRAIREVSARIPDSLDWVLIVEGHTDRRPLSGSGQYADNWELSQARALSVARFLLETGAVLPERIAAAGFGEHQPADPADTPEAWTKNRRIALKFSVH